MLALAALPALQRGRTTLACATCVAIRYTPYGASRRDARARPATA